MAPHPFTWRGAGFLMEDLWMDQQELFDYTRAQHPQCAECAASLGVSMPAMAVAVSRDSIEDSVRRLLVFICENCANDNAVLPEC